MRRTLILALLVLACASFRSSGGKKGVVEDPRANELMGKAKSSFDAEEYKDAVRYLEELAREYRSSKYYDDALYLLAISEYRLENYQLAVAYVNRLQGEQPGSSFSIKAWAVLGEANYALKNYYDAAVAFVKLQERTTERTEQEKAQEKLMLILPNLKITELERLHRSAITNPLDEHILYHLGEREISAGKIDQGKRDLELLLKRFPSSQYERQVEELLASATVGRTTRTIGVLLPLSGKFAQYGNDVKNLLDFFIIETKFVYPVKYLDTKSDGLEALRSAIRLSQDYRVDVIVGPIFSLEALSVCGMASALKTPVILPTITDPRFESTAPSMIQLNVSAASEAIAVARYASRGMGAKKFGIFYPNDAAGEMLAQLFEEEIRNQGGEIVGRVGFRPDTTTFGREIEALKKTNPEVVFFPGDDDQIVLIAPQFAYYGIDKIKLLGIRGFNEEKVARLGEKYVEGAVFAVQQYTPKEDAAKVMEKYEAQRGKKTGFTERKFLEAMYGLSVAMAADYSRATIADEMRRAFKKDRQAIRIFMIKDSRVTEVIGDSLK